MVTKPDIVKNAKWFIYLLIVLFISTIIYVTLYIVIENMLVAIETIISDRTGFADIGSRSNAITAIIGLSLLTLTLFYLLATREMVQEMRKQRAIIEEPAVSLKAVPSADAANAINLVLKNTGGGPAYDVSVKFDPDIPYWDDISLNKINLFHKMSLLDKGEIVELFLASAPEYFKSDKPKKTIATIEYYTTPHHQRNNNSGPRRIRIIEIDFEERRNQLQVRHRGINDLVEEIEELKQGLLLIASNVKNDEVDEK